MRGSRDHRFPECQSSCWFEQMFRLHCDHPLSEGTAAMPFLRNQRHCVEKAPSAGSRKRRLSESHHAQWAHRLKKPSLARKQPVDMISLCHCCAIDGLLARARPRGGAPNLLSCLIPHPRTIMGGNCCHALPPQSKPAFVRPSFSSGGLLTRARPQAGAPSVHELTGSRNHRLPESNQWT